MGFCILDYVMPISTFPRIHVCPAHISRAHRYACMTIGVGELERKAGTERPAILTYLFIKAGL